MVWPQGQPGLVALIAGSANLAEAEIRFLNAAADAGIHAFTFGVSDIGVVHGSAEVCILPRGDRASWVVRLRDGEQQESQWFPDFDAAAEQAMSWVLGSPSRAEL